MKLTDKQLIEIALQRGEVESSKQLEEVEQFVFDMKIEATPGQAVPANLIYYHYILWKESLGEIKILSRKGFFKIFKQHFKRHIASGNRYYNVNKDAFKLDLDTKLAIRKLLHEEREWYKKRNARLKRKGTV